MVICLRQGANDFAADATATPLSLVQVKSTMVYLSGASLPGCPVKDTIKRVSVLLL